MSKKIQIGVITKPRTLKERVLWRLLNGGRETTLLVIGSNAKLIDTIDITVKGNKEKQRETT